MASHTLFVAIRIPDDAARRLAARQPARARGVRPVRREQLHLTLAFLGRTPVEPVDDALSTVRGQAFETSLEALGKFGSSRRRLVLWAGIEPVPDLLRLQADVADALRASGHVLEDRPYRPHVTLARCPRGFPRDRLAAFLEGNVAGSFRVEAFGLYSSRPGDGGPDHRLEREYPLQS